MTMDLPRGSTTSISDLRKPLPSVFSPMSFPLRFTAQLTAPMMAALSPRPSRCWMTSTLCGIDRLKPRQPMARAPFTASASFSGDTSQLM